MDALNARLEEMMRMMAEERAQRLATKETLRQTQAHLEAAIGQQTAAQQPPPAATPAATPNSIVLAKPQPFNGTRGALAE